MEPLYDANESITLDRTIVKLVNGPSCLAQVVLGLSPAPAIHFDLLDSSREFQMALLDTFVEDRPVVIKLPSGQEVQVLVGKQGLIATSGSVTALDTDKPLHAVRFGIVNFPDVMKPRSAESQADAETSWSIEDLWTIRLRGDPWLVEIRPVDNRVQVHKSLSQQPGFALTHWGEVTRSDGKPFPRESVQPLLRTLNQFLSFARGVSCGMTLIKGLDEIGETVWEVWGVTNVQPWKGHTSCLDRLNGAALEDLFMGFWCYIRANSRDSQIHPALEWYLESNAQEASHTSIVLNQAALESLTSETVGEREKKEKQGDWIARSLRRAQADIRIPEPFIEILGTKNFDHGPHALVTIRNDLVHPKVRNGIPCSKVQRQARELGLWYVELLLLKRFGYSGLYSNRLTKKWVGDEERVPWGSPV